MTQDLHSRVFHQRHLELHTATEVTWSFLHHCKCFVLSSLMQMWIKSKPNTCILQDFAQRKLLQIAKILSMQQVALKFKVKHFNRFVYQT